MFKSAQQPLRFKLLNKLLNFTFPKKRGGLLIFLCKFLDATNGHTPRSIGVIRTCAHIRTLETKNPRAERVIGRSTTPKEAECTRRTDTAVVTVTHINSRQKTSNRLFTLLLFQSRKTKFERF